MVAISSGVVGMTADKQNDISQKPVKSDIMITVMHTYLLDG